MAIIEETFFGIECDNCGETCPNHDFDAAFYPDKEGAKENAINGQEWHETDDKKYYCQDCHHFDDDDNLVVGHAEKIAHEKKQFNKD